MPENSNDFHAAGGAVRDLLLGRAYRDVDYIFTCPEQDFIQRNPTARKIENHGSPLYFLRGQEYIPLQRTPGTLEDSFAHDLARRDFTINALLLSSGGVLRLHPDALDDLRKGVLRPASPTSLRDDPVRALRAARFTALLPDFSLHAGCREQMADLAARNALAAIAAEQVGKETIKACVSPKPGNFLRSLQSTGCLAPWFAEFAHGGGLPAGPAPFHDATVLEHTARVMDAVAANSSFADARQASLAVWMALCHDIGKTATPQEILPRHLMHEKRGRELARALGARLRLPSLYIKAGELACALHMKAARYFALKPGTKVDILETLCAARLSAPFFYMVAADSRQERLPQIMQRDMERIARITLPEKWRNLGSRSGERLRQMRCAALSTEKTK